MPRRLSPTGPPPRPLNRMLGVRLAFPLVLTLACAAGAANANGFESRKGHGGPIMGLATSADGTLASASFDNSVGLWSGDQPAWQEGHDAAVTTVVFMQDGRLLSGGDDFAVRLWSPDGNRLLGRHKGKVQGLAASPDGTLIASASWDGAIGLWTLDGAAPVMLTRHQSGVNDVAFAPDGRTLYAATSRGDIVSYDTQTQQMLPLVKHGFSVNELAIAADGSWLAYGAVDGVTRVIDPESGLQIADFTLDRRPILALAAHAPTHQLAVGDGDGYIMVIDTETWSISRDFRAMARGPVWALAYTPDGKRLYAGGISDTIYGWPVALIDRFEPQEDGQRSFLRDPETMPNGERQFMRKCSICHALEPGPSRKAGPTLYGVFGRAAGAVPDYPYSPTLSGSDIVWNAESIDALFDLGPDHYIPGSKMPMQRITGSTDRSDLIAFLQSATKPEEN